ncbi:MAG: L,D-transpeptidase family protein [Eubacterium sp.]|nr:L,D-transpeptidase family protein [Eubacterium sp.]
MGDNKLVYSTFEDYLKSIGVEPAVSDAAGSAVTETLDEEPIITEDQVCDEPVDSVEESVLPEESPAPVENAIVDDEQSVPEQQESDLDEMTAEAEPETKEVQAEETAIEEPAAEPEVQAEESAIEETVAEPEAEQSAIETEPEPEAEQSAIETEPETEPTIEPVLDEVKDEEPAETEASEEPIVEPATEPEPVKAEEPAVEPGEPEKTESAPEVLNEESSGEEPEEEEEPRGGCFGVFIVFLLLFMIAAGSFVALDRFVVHGNRFLPDTTINGVDVGEMNIRQASKALETDWASHTLEIKMNGETVDTLSELDLAYNADQKVEDTLHAGWVECIKRLLSKKARKLEIELQPNPDEGTFDTTFESLNIVKNHKETVKSEDAYIDLSNTDFNIVNEVYGDSLDKEKLKTALINAIAVGQSEFDYSPAKFYLEPKIKSNSKEIAEEMKYCEKYLSHVIKYKGFKGFVKGMVITPDQVNKFISVADDGTVKVNKNKVQKFVEETVCPHFSTEGIDRKIKSLATGKKFEVSGGDYGLAVSVEQEVKQLTKDLKSLKSVERMPKYTTEVSEDQTNDIGNTYVEVDLTNQVLYYVENGKVKVECNIVTGTEATGHGTPQGVYAIKYMATHVTLKGRNDDGSKYESKVTYWMPFNLPYEIGLHDATWRGAFGGGIYYYNGSHGCVNMPFNSAQALYGRVEVGTIVICHY